MSSFKCICHIIHFNKIPRNFLAKWGEKKKKINYPELIIFLKKWLNMCKVWVTSNDHNLTNNWSYNKEQLRNPETIYFQIQQTSLGKCTKSVHLWIHRWTINILSLFRMNEHKEVQDINLLKCFSCNRIANLPTYQHFLIRTKIAMSVKCSKKSLSV